MSVDVKNLTFVYNKGLPFETTALDEVSCSFRKGKITGIMGRTGCGKTTLVQLIAGLEVPASGSILIDGEDINADSYDRTALRRRLGIVFQYPERQLFEATVYKDVGFGLKHFGLSEEEKKERIYEALETMGFDPKAVESRSPLAASGGEKRRLAIAGVLAVRPEYLILDEPVAGLDPAGREVFEEVIRDLNRKGMTIIVVSHNGDFIADITDDLIVMEKGKIAMLGSTVEVFSDIDGLKELGIGVSRAREIADSLKKRGVEIKDDIITVDELVRALTERGRC